MPRFMMLIYPNITEERFVDELLRDRSMSAHPESAN